MFTSLKALKWAYNLGVSQERQRVASYLQLENKQANTFNNAALEMLNDPINKKEATRRRKQKLDLQVAVNSRIREIINGMFESQGQWIDGPSVMYPDKETK